MKKNSKNSLSEITVIPPSMVVDAGRFATQELTQLDFWGRLTPTKQVQLKEEVNEFLAAKMMHVQSGLAMGRTLQSIKIRCAPYSGAFKKIVEYYDDFRLKTAYRYIDSYNNAREAFNDNILKAAMAQGMNIVSYSKDEPLGKYTEAVRKLPPPETATPTEAKRYVDQLEKTDKDLKKFRHSETVREVTIATAEDKRELLKQNFRGIKNALKQLPPRSRRPFLDDLFGMALTCAGVSSSVTFSPQAVPEEFNQGPGYPTGRPRGPRNPEEQESAAA